MALPLLVEDLVVRGDAGRTLLAVEHLAVEAGGCVGIRGPSGAGKSTLLFAIAGLLPLASGRIHWAGTDLLSLGEAGKAVFRRRHVGLIFQDFLLFEELGALANAAIGTAYAAPEARAKIRDRAHGMLKRLGIAAESARTVRSFSGGERQRVAVARALAHDPDIILADEPTANLDRDAADRLIDDLASLARTTGKTLVAVSHDPTLHRRMDRIFDIADGHLVTPATADA